MSYSTLYAVNRKSVRALREFQNGWGSHPVVWEYLGAKYLGFEGYMDRAAHDQVWALGRSGRLTPEEQAVLLMTFDHAYVPRANLLNAAQACELFHKATLEMPVFENRVNHWGDIGLALRQLDIELRRDVRGVALNGTSVSDIWENKGALDKAWPIFKELTDA